MAGNPPLLEPVRRSLRLRHYSIRTERAYLDWIRRFILFHHKRHPSGMGSDEIRQFLSHVAADRAVAAATQNQPLSALLYLYREVLGVELSYVESIERAKRPARVPVVLIREEANSILSHMHGTYRLMARLLYGSGQRLMECVRLRIKDVDFGYRQVTVRDGEGEKDRRTMLPESLVEQFGRHLARVRLLHEDDLLLGYGRVHLPYALERKHPNAASEWVWQWVFAAGRLSKDTRTGEMRRHHASEDMLQAAAPALLSWRPVKS
jgi:integron integrase